MNFNNIVNKFGYNLEFSTFLKQVYDELVVYYGSEEIVYEAFLNTPIISHNNVYDYLKEQDLLDSSDTLVSDNDLKRSSGVCQSVPEIFYEESTNLYHIKNIRRCVVVVNLDLNSTTSRATLIHELSHLVKSYYEEYKIEGNTLITRSGLQEQHYELSFDGQKVSKKLVKELGTGLEEGLTSVCEEDITRKIIDANYQSSGYGVVNVMARNLLAIPNIKEVIFASQLYHDKEELYNTLDKEAYIKLEELADKVYELILEMFSQVFEPEKMRETSNKIRALLNAEYKEIMEKLNGNLKLD